MWPFWYVSVVLLWLINNRNTKLLSLLNLWCEIKLLRWKPRAGSYNGTYAGISPLASFPQPDVYPGNCWALKGSQGYLVIRLSLRILPTSFCMEHIPRAMSPTGNITSAPRDFTVLVRHAAKESAYNCTRLMRAHFSGLFFRTGSRWRVPGRREAAGTLHVRGRRGVTAKLSCYGNWRSSFSHICLLSANIHPVLFQEQNDRAFQIIEVRVLSNWGHPEYTCMYRFRVHGEPRPQWTNHHSLTNIPLSVHSSDQHL